MKQQSAEGGRKGPEGRFFRWIAGSWEASLLLHFICVCICWASPCVFLHAAASSNLHFFFFFFLVSATCLWIWHVAWKCIVKEPRISALYVTVLCYLLVGRDYSQFIKPPTCPGTGRTSPDALKSLSLSHTGTSCNLHNEDCLSNMDGKVPQGLQCAFFNGRGALLPSVAGSGALQPRVGRLKQSIIIVGNKYRLPAKSWSAPSVAGSFFF